MDDTKVSIKLKIDHSKASVSTYKLKVKVTYNGKSTLQDVTINLKYDCHSEIT